jgi:hypothetical protein
LREEKEEQSMNKFEMVMRVLEDNQALLPVDVATQLVNEGYDISSLGNALDGYSLEDFIDRYEEMYG